MSRLNEKRRPLATDGAPMMISRQGSTARNVAPDVIESEPFASDLGPDAWLQRDVNSGPFVVHLARGPLAGFVAAAAAAGIPLRAMCGFTRVPSLPLPERHVRCVECDELAALLDASSRASQ